MNNSTAADPFPPNIQTPRIAPSYNELKGKPSKIFIANFKIASDKFSGAFEENWPRYLQTYQPVCEEAVTSAQEKLQFLRHVLRDEALEFSTARSKTLLKVGAQQLLC